MEIVSWLDRAAVLYYGLWWIHFDLVSAAAGYLSQHPFFGCWKTSGFWVGSYGHPPPIHRRHSTADVAVFPVDTLWSVTFKQISPICNHSSLFWQTAWNSFCCTFELKVSARCNFSEIISPYDSEFFWYYLNFRPSPLCSQIFRSNWSEKVNLFPCVFRRSLALSLSLRRWFRQFFKV